MCHTRHCHNGNIGNKVSANIIKLVQFINKFDGEQEAIEWLEKFLGIKSYSTRDLDIVRHRLSIQEMQIIPIERRINKIFDEKYLDRFDGENDYYIVRGYKQSTLDHFDIKCCDEMGHRFYNRMIIPIRDARNKLVGISARWIGDNEIDNQAKFIHTGGLAKGHILYNWFGASKYFATRHVILTEGPGVVWRLREIGVYNAVAVLGSQMTKNQAKMLLRDPNIDKAMLLFDSDEAGQSGADASVRMLKNYLKVDRMEFKGDLDAIEAHEYHALYTQARSKLKEKR